MTMYINKRNGEMFELISENDTEVTLALNGEEKTVKTSTFKRWYAKAEVTDTSIEIEPVEEETATTEEQEVVEETEEKKEPVKVGPTVNVANVTRMIEHVLTNAKAEYVIEEKTLIVGDQAVLKILKDGVAIKEKDAKANNLNYTLKKYNHAFKAKIEVDNTGTMEELLRCLLEKEYDVVMYDTLVRGSSVTGNEVEVIGECKLQLTDGKVIEQYLYNIIGYEAKNGKPFSSHKGNIILA